MTAPNGLTHSYSYDALNRLRTLSLAKGAATLQNYTYSLNPSGHRHLVSESTGRTATYAYDGIYRLTQETIAGAGAQNGTVDYTLDKVGNRTARLSSLPSVQNQNSTFNVRDWLNSDSYDSNGNTTLSSGVTTQDIYDFEDRLIIRRKADGSTVNLSYDADGIRRQKTLLNAASQLVSTTSYLIDTNNHTGYAQVIEEYENSGTGISAITYTYGHDLISQVRTTTAFPYPVTRYYGYDGLGSVRFLTNAGGLVTDTYDYDAFGNLIAAQTLDPNTQTLIATTAAAAAGRNAYLYRGEQFDADLGMYSLRARFYNQATGRFWNQDSYEGSSGDPASLHKYLYANADPVMFSDSTGHMSLAEVNLTGFAVATIAVIATPQVFQMGVTAVRTLLEAGLYGAEQAAEGFYSKLASLTLTLEILKANEKVKAKTLTVELNDPSVKKAIIGESMSRVGTAALVFNAETFTPISFLGGLLPEFPLQDQNEFNYWMWANRAWVRSVMVRQLFIIDIGRDTTKVGLGIKQSEFYSMELQETAGYMRKTNQFWPPSFVDLKLK